LAFFSGEEVFAFLLLESLELLPKAGLAGRGGAAAVLARVPWGVAGKGTITCGDFNGNDAK